MEELSLGLIIEGLREKMMQLATDKGRLLDQEVVQISQKLDHYLVQFQKLRVKQKIQLDHAV